MDEEDEEDGPHCNNSGRCVAPEGARRITNCKYCGKELHEKDDQWWTWDADKYPDPKPQGYVT